MGKKHLATVQQQRWSAPAPTRLTPEQKTLRVLYRERDRAQGRIDIIESLIQERDRLADQVVHIREFAERVMESADEKDEEIDHLTQVLLEKAAKIDALEKTQHSQGDRLSLLETTLKRLAESGA